MCCVTPRAAALEAFMTGLQPRRAVSSSAAAIFMFAALLVQGCAPVILGGVAGGATVAHDSRTTGTVIEDETIELKIANSVFEDSELRARAHINATSYNTMVLLTGETPTEAMRQRVEEQARHTDKVSQVYNELRVAPPSSLSARTNDTWITTKVKTQLFRIKGFDPTRVKVVTEHSVVYLMGLLTRKEASAVAELSRRVGGIQKVVKFFEVIDAPAATTAGAP